jgi:hypothetical protein
MITTQWSGRQLAHEVLVLISIDYRLLQGLLNDLAHLLARGRVASCQQVDFVLEIDCDYEGRLELERFPINLEAHIALLNGPNNHFSTLGNLQRQIHANLNLSEVQHIRYAKNLKHSIVHAAKLELIGLLPQTWYTARPMRDVKKYNIL